MKILFFLSVLLALFSQTLTKVSRINQYISEARTAYLQKDFGTAIYFYRYLYDSMQVQDRSLRLNMAHAYFLKNNKVKAFKSYQALLKKASTATGTVVNLQLGVLALHQNKQDALEYFKKAIILDPTNQEARYNFELLKKYLILHPEENNKPLPPPQPESARQENKSQNKDNQTTGNKENPEGQNEAEISDFNNQNPDNAPEPDVNNTNNNSGEAETNKEPNLNSPNASPQSQRKINTGTLPGTKRGTKNEEDNTNNGSKGTGGREESDIQDKNSQTTYDRLREANISPEKARILLEAMREAEIQYLQQIPRKGSQKQAPGKPTW